MIILKREHPVRIIAEGALFTYEAILRGTIFGFGIESIRQ